MTALVSGHIIQCIPCFISIFTHFKTDLFAAESSNFLRQVIILTDLLPRYLSFEISISYHRDACMICQLMFFSSLLMLYVTEYYCIISLLIWLQ